jgi:hypothetical protein
LKHPESSDRLKQDLRKPQEGQWLSWESDAFATRRSWVRIPSAPPNLSRGYGIDAVTPFSLVSILVSIVPAICPSNPAPHFHKNGVQLPST